MHHVVLYIAAELLNLLSCHLSLPAPLVTLNFFSVSVSLLLLLLFFLIKTMESSTHVRAILAQGSC